MLTAVLERLRTYLMEAFSKLAAFCNPKTTAEAGKDVVTLFRHVRGRAYVQTWSAGKKTTHSVPGCSVLESTG